jgi:uncharacterized protein (DUF1015 family)
MAYIAPFRALRYDPGRVPVSRVVTQPYDKITPQTQDHYYEANPYNLVRIILGRRLPADSSADNVYTRAAAFFRDWRQQGIFVQDSQPALYLYSQRFTAPGTKTEFERRGFIGLGRIEDYSAGIVFRHEQTLAKPKADRLDLLRATCAHFGQLFMLYSDSGEIESLLSIESPADMEVTDEYGVHHRIWKVSDPHRIGLVCSQMQDKKLIIADGHHRYETALSYRDERRSIVAGTAPNSAPSRGSADKSVLAAGGAAVAPFDWVMMTFININSPGLLILPTHRVVHGLASFSSERFRTAAETYFRVEEESASLDAARATGILHQAGRTGTALVAVMADRAYLMHSPKPAGSSRLAGLSLRQQSLDVVQLHKCLLEDVLGLSEESIRTQQNVSYVRDPAEALERVRDGGANVAFLMNPVRIEQVRDLALAGEVLPQKSTDFYPKLLSGLTIYALD